MTGFDSGAGGRELPGYSKGENKNGPAMGVEPAHVSTTGNAYKINYELIRGIFKGVKTCTNLCTNSFFLTFIALDCTELH